MGLVEKYIKTLDSKGISNEKVTQSRQRLNLVISSIEQVIFEEGSSDVALGDVLWKKGGHPAIPLTSSSCSAVLGLRKTLDACSLVNEGAIENIADRDDAMTVVASILVEECHPVLFTSRKDREEMLDALCMCYWNCTNESRGMATNNSKSRNVPDIYRLIASSLKRKRDTFAERWNAAKVDTAIATVENLLDIEKLEQIRSSLEDPTNSAHETVHSDVLGRLAILQVISISEFWCLRQEQIILDKVCCLQMMKNPHERSNELQTISKLVSTFLEEAITNYVWPLSDLRPFKTLLWAVDASLDQEKLFLLIKMILPTMMANASSHVWRTPVCGLNFVASKLELPPQWAAHLNSTSRIGLWFNGSNLDGPPRLQKRERTDSMIALLGSHFQGILLHKRSHFVTLENNSVRQQQASMLVKNLSQCTSDDTAHSHAPQVQCMFWNVVEALKGFFDESDFDELKTTQWSNQSIQRLQELLEKCRYPRFKECQKKIVEPLIRCFFSTQPSRLAEAWVLVGLLHIHLLTPTSPLDPAQKPLVKVKQHELHLQFLNTLFGTYKRQQRLQIGCTSKDNVASVWTDSMTRLETKKERQSKKHVERPENRPPFIQLFRELKGFSITIADMDSVLLMLRKFQAKDVVDLEKLLHGESGWQSTASAFCDRLVRDYTCYEDVTTPFIVAVRSIQTGLRLARSSLQEKNLGGNMQKIQGFYDRSLSFPTNIDTSSLRGGIREVNGFFSNVEATENSRAACLGMHLAALSCVVLLKHQLRSPQIKGALNFSIGVFDAITDSLQCDDDDFDNQNSNEDDDLEREYREQFPDHGKDFKNFMQSQDEAEYEEDSAKETNEPTETPIGQRLTQQHLSLVCELHQNIFSSRSCGADASRLMSFQLFYGTASAMRQTLPDLSFADLKSERMGSHALGVAIAASANTNLSQKSVGKCFHTDPDPEEVKKAYLPLQFLMKRVTQLLTAFPGHAVLVSLGQVIEYVNKLDITSTPVGKFMTGLEVVLKKAQEWEQHASKKVKLGLSLSQVSHLVAQWRKVELNSWANLLDSRESRFVKRARRHWMKMYGILRRYKLDIDSENTILCQGTYARRWVWKNSGKQSIKRDPNYSHENVEQLTKILDTFVLSSTLGEFEERMRIIKAFSEQFFAIAQSERTVDATLKFYLFASVWSFYSQFFEFLRTEMAKLRDPIETRLKNETKIAKWDEQSYYALVDTSERNHRKLMKLLREYDDVMQTPVASILERRMCDGIRSVGAEGNEPCMKVPSEKMMFPLWCVHQPYEPKNTSRASPLERNWSTKLTSIATKKDYFHRMRHYYQRMRKIVSSETNSHRSWAHLGTEFADEFVAAIFGRIDLLRNEKTTRPMKQRALTDLFKVLNENGFKATKWSVPGELREMSHIFQLPTPQSPSAAFFSDKCRAILADVNDYFNRSLAEVRQLRSEASMCASKHLSLRQVELMVNLSDHGMLLITQQRAMLAENLDALNDLATVLDQHRTAEEGIPSNHERLVFHYESFVEGVAVALESLEQVRLGLSIISPVVEGSTEKKTIMDAQAMVDEVISKLRSHLNLLVKRHVITSPILNEARRCLSGIESAINRLESIRRLVVADCSVPPDIFDTCIDHAKEALNKGVRLVNEPSKPSTENGDVNAVAESACETIERTLLAIQKVSKDSSSQSTLEENEDMATEEHATWEIHKRICREWESFDIAGLSASFGKLSKSLINLKQACSVEERKWASMITMDVLVLLEEAMSLAANRFVHLLKFSRSSAKLEYVLVRVFRTLVAKGFCSDEAEENDNAAGDASGATFEDVEGTGMGEGDGKNDVTDQIEDEEQLLGLKNDQKPEDKGEKQGSQQLDEEEANKGMEMEADFEGDMFDVPEDTKNDENDKEDDEEEELDREMGDGSDPNEEVVDEKMWGESDDEEEIDENEEKFEKNSKVKGEPLEDEMRTKEDGEEDRGGEDKGEKPGADHDQNKDVASDEKEEENVGDEDSDMEINDDNEDNYEEKHVGVDVRNEEDQQDEKEDDAMELEDDLSLDDNDNGDDDTDNASNEDDVAETAAEVALDEEKEDDNGEMEENQEEEAMESSTPHGGDSSEQIDQEEDPELHTEQASAEHSKQETYGVRSKDGADNVRQDAEQDAEEEGQAENGQGEDEEVPVEKEEAEQQEEPSSSGDGGKQGSDGQRMEGQGENEGSQLHDEVPNPFKNPGDAKKHWHKKLKMIARTQGDDANDGKEEEEEEDTEMMVEEEQDANAEFEYTDKNEQSNSQVLGETTEEQAIQIDAEDEEQNDEQDEAPDETVEGGENVEESMSSKRKSSKKSTTPNQQAQQVESDSEDEKSHASDEESIQGGSNKEDEMSDDPMDEDANNDDEKMGNRVVSDLAQLNVDEDLALHSTPDITVHEQVTGISSEEALEARKKWSNIAASTNHLARRLCEKLRLVMEPLVATKLRGDYRTGKRINMKRIIGYIASGYRKDKIWLRRTKPAKRDYRVLLAVDNSQSMKKNNTGDTALAAMATLATGMSQLEIGELGISSFGEEMKLLHPFHMPFTPESGANIVYNFQFDETRTRTALCVESALKAFESLGDEGSMQLVFLISDGRIERDSRTALRRLVREMMERNILLVMIVVEGGDGKTSKKDSIIHMKEVSFHNGKPQVKQFIEDYPFPYYIILDDVQSLPEVLGDALRQWFEMIAQLQQGR